MKRIIPIIAALIMLTGCSATPAPDQTYSSASRLAKTFENTTFASEHGYTCTIEDRASRNRSEREHGYERGECTSDEAVGSNDHFGLVVAKTPQGEAWMTNYPLIHAMPSTRAVIKGPEQNWQITGPIDPLGQIQDELGGQMTIGTGPTS